MASKAIWEVDPETRSKLAALQREHNNNLCCDCNAPSPQWASPKFGIFICLSCAGVHRGLGVHISFVRSISMDAFKANEIERMRLGGNDNWRRFFEEHEDTQMRGLTWDDATIAERYGGEVGEEWKERLACRAEGREYVAGEKKPPPVPSKQPQQPQQQASSASRTATPLSASRSQSPGTGAGVGAGRTTRVDDQYFARLGASNASRPDDVPPSQGGRYSGFGNSPASAASAQGGGGGGMGGGMLPLFEDVQRDPVAALTKGFGWFTSTVQKTAKTVNDGYIQPTAKSLAEGDFAKQAQLTAAQIARQAQIAGKNAQEGFTRFVEGPAEHGSRGAGGGAGGAGGGPGGLGARSRDAPLDASRKDFWDDFSSLADQPKASTSSAIGTSAIGMGKSKGAGGAGAQKQTNDEWDDW
ncbi:ADP-ribosylation factor GTPase-activating protein GCS1 [Escovopsis weberi]|uniref:ADP-ribosylation factor GTPase-activating protein GCS1 n=1 Tax=Escovopsis weberi TaxID=150374 RepID=A0A0M8MYN4_ESCWE|nr:ADP-ribosylation factor GTPase-activating protein GCS1 [Escovopsis weberi]